MPEVKQQTKRRDEEPDDRRHHVNEKSKKCLQVAKRIYCAGNEESLPTSLRATTPTSLPILVT